MKCLLLLITAAVAAASEVTPVQKVIQLLDNMKEKGTKEMEEEQVQFTRFKQFCETTLAEKERSISDATDKMEVLEADVEGATSEIARLTEEIGGHSADIETAVADQENATAIRKQERADFQVELKDYTESIDAVGRALKVMKEQDKKVSLVQLSEIRKLKTLPQDALDSIDAYLSASSDAAEKKPALLMERASSDDAQAPQPKTYEFQSGGVIEMLENLLDKFVDKRVTLEKEEAKKKHAFDLLVQGLAAEESAEKKNKEEKTEFKAKQQQTKAAAQGDLEETTAERESDQKYYDDLKATFAKKTSDFDTRQKTRTEEIEAIGKAREIISGGAISGSADQHLPSLLQTKSVGSALAFLRSEVKNPSQAQVAKFLQQQATLLNSRVLSAAAARVGEDPMAKVRTMMEQLIVKMQEQANEEATKKGWCDAELATNKATREEKTDAVDALGSEIDELSSAITTLGEETVTLSKEITEMNAAMAEATEIRQKEKHKNTATIKDAKEAQAAVAQAVGVLKEFYAKAGEATAFVQTSASRVHSDQPAIFGDEPYTGMGGESGGVVAMLEVIESDFARLEAETIAAEAASKKEYDDFMEDSKVDKATKQKTVEHKTNKKQTKSQEKTVLEGDLQGTHKELDAANAYFEKLKPDCLDAGKSYAERKAQREQEVKDLQEALDMMNTI